MTQLATNLTDYLSAHPYLAILILFLIAFGEAMLFIGLFVPSTPIMIGAGALVGLGKLGLFPVLIASAAGAIAGDALSFWIGRRGKHHLVSIWPLSTHPQLLEKGERFFARYGSLSIFLARFVPGVKAVLPTVAGMAGMSPTRFAVVNVLSAFVWSAAHLFPSMLVGRGLGVAATTNPKIIELFGAILILSGFAWITARLLARTVVPRLAGVGDKVAARWAASDRPGRRWLGRKLVAANRSPGLLAEITLAVAAASGVIILGVLILLDPELSRADAALAGWVEAQRSELATEVMLGVTMLADWRVLFPLAVIMLAYLAVVREGRLAVVLASAFAATLTFVPLVKLLVQRSRPTQLYNGAEAFSFPSGHATHATVILGAAALLVASSLTPRLRKLVYGGTAVLVLVVSLSRVYLGAHWPTDVIAGMLFGAVVLILVAALTRNQRLGMKRTGLSAVVVLAFAGLYGGHLVRNYSAAAAFYTPGPTAVTVARADWSAGKVATPSNRILLDGDAGEPMLLQTDLPLGDLVALLQSGGWSPANHSWIAEVADAVLPTRGDIGSLAPWPLAHLGHRPVATLTQSVAGSSTSRHVLRVWDSGLRIAGPDQRTVLLLSTATEVLDPLGAGFFMLDSEAATNLDPALLAQSGLKTLTVPNMPPILIAN